jgi:hypothetical protein
MDFPNYSRSAVTHLPTLIGGTLVRPFSLMREYGTANRRFQPDRVFDLLYNGEYLPHNGGKGKYDPYLDAPS